MNVFVQRIHEPSLIFHSSSSSHPYSKVFIHPIYMQSFNVPSVPYQQVQYIPSAPAHHFSYGPILYGSPFFKHFNHIVKAQVWEG